MNLNLANRFWNRWYKADELQKVKIVKELMIENSAVDPHATATLVNSFFCDLAEFLEKKRDRDEQTLETH